jgi:cell volume regulation protein A
MKVYDGLAWMMQIVLFLTLGLLVFPSDIIPVLGIGLVISLALIFVARPIGVFLSLLPFKMRLQRRFYISWVGLRGAVPIVFATYPLLAGIDKANMMFHIVFFISVTSILIQGTTLSIMAKWFGVAAPEEKQSASDIEKFLYDLPKAVMKEIEILPNCKSVGKSIVELEFPKNAIIAIIKRNESFLTPKGTTIIQPGDKLYVLSENEEGLNEVNDCLLSKSANFS